MPAMGQREDVEAVIDAVIDEFKQADAIIQKQNTKGATEAEAAGIDVKIYTLACIKYAITVGALLAHQDPDFVFDEAIEVSIKEAREYVKKYAPAKVQH